MDLSEYEFPIDVNLQTLQAHLERFQTNYLFSAVKVSTLPRYDDHGIVVFPDAARSFYTMATGEDMPADCDHLLRHLNVGSAGDMPARIMELRRNDALTKPTPERWISRSLDQLYTIRGDFDTDPANTHFMPQEFFLQEGPVYTPPHIDFGRNLAFIPPFCEGVVKIWVSIPFAKIDFRITYDEDGFMRLASHPFSTVVCQRPGDVIYQSSLAVHTVLTGYKATIPSSHRWCVIGGNMFVRQGDEYAAYLYATRATIGQRRYTGDVWDPIFTTFASLYNWSLNQDFEEEFEKKLHEHPSFHKGRQHSATVRWKRERNKKKTKEDSLAAARAAKKVKATKRHD